MSKDKKDIIVEIDNNMKIEYNYERHKVHVIYENQIRKVFNIDDYDTNTFFQELDKFMDSLRTNEKKRQDFKKQLTKRYSK